VKQGLIQIYMGDGKGKTTAAAGLALRAVGRGQHVLFVQFLKNKPSGEVLLIQERIPEIVVMRFSSQNIFIRDMNEEQREILRRETAEGLSFVKEIAASGSCDMLILDEVLGACKNGFISKDEIIAIMKNKATGLELVLTGRDAPQEILAAADLVTEMKKIKHPFDQGVGARMGIEQ
jgi:cob(I)alamin adenosyltransferase